MSQYANDCSSIPLPSKVVFPEFELHEWMEFKKNWFRLPGITMDRPRPIGHTPSIRHHD